MGALLHVGQIAFRRTRASLGEGSKYHEGSSVVDWEPLHSAAELLLQYVRPADRAACRLVCKRWHSLGLALPLRVSYGSGAKHEAAARWASLCPEVKSWVLLAEPTPLSTER